MAILNGLKLAYALSGYGAAYYNPSITIEFSDWSDKFSLSNELMSGLLTLNNPVEVASRSIQGITLKSWFDDYYNRVHVNPSKLDLGNVLSTQTRQVEVWNAHFTDKIYNGFETLGDVSGLIVNGLESGVVFAKNESKLVDISISNVGSPTIDALIRFDFSSEKPVVAITGQRLVVFPYKPTQDFNESFEWFTDVIKSKSTEQRIALRDVPRLLLSYNFVLSSAEYSRLKAISNKWLNQVFAVPYWPDKTFVGNVNESSTSINLDTSLKDFRSNDLIFVFNEDVFEAVEVLTVSSSSIQLARPFRITILNAYVVPLRYARLSGELTISRGSDQLIWCKALFIVQRNALSASISQFTKFLNTPVLLDDVYNTSPIDHSISRESEWFDNNSGKQSVESLLDYNTATQNLNVNVFSKIKLNQYKGFFGYLKGRQKTFFFPSKNSDLKLVSDIGAGSNSLTVESVNYENYFSVSYISIHLKNGSIIFKRVNSGSSNSSIDVLTVSEVFSVGISKADVEMICFMSLVRLDTDTVKFKHLSNNIVDISFTTVEVPDVV